MELLVVRKVSQFFNVVLVVGLSWCWPAQAAIFTVTSTVDATDIAPGNGLCETAAGNGVCTLRAAIQEANAGGGPHSITLPAGTFTLTLAGTGENSSATGDLDIMTSLSVIGAGRASTVIDGNGADRVFHIVTGSLSLNALTVRNGRRDGPGTDATVVGGAVHAEGGALGLYDVAVRDNFAALDGGAIYTIDRVISIVNSVIENNSAGSRGGAIALYSNNGGYGIGQLTVQDSILKGNSAPYGGAIYCARGTVNATRSRVQSNIASGGAASGGGLHGYQCVSTITQSTFDQNRATVKGGAFSFTSSNASIINSTLSGNGTGNMDRLGGSGGAVYATSSTVALHNATVANNIANTGPAIYTEVVSTFQLANSIIADNLGSRSFPSEIYGGLSSSGHNLIKLYQSTYNGSSDTGNATDIIGQDPLLGPLSDNGGVTPTHALLPGSPAIDTGDPTGCKVGASLISQDQRSQPRTLDGDNNGAVRCDVGAYEYAFAPGFIISPVRGLVTTELGGSATFQVRLNSAPTSPVTLPLSSSDATEGTVSPTQLLFDAGNWSSWQTVTVQGLNDSLADGAVSYSAVTGSSTSSDAAFNELDPTDVAVSNYDDESAAIVIAPATGITTTEGGWSTFAYVTMASPPTSDVTLVLTIADTTEGTFLMPGGTGIPQPGGGMSDGSYTTLVFTPDNWFVQQSLAIYPVNDNTVDADVTYAINASVSSADPAYNTMAVAPVMVTNVNSDSTPPPSAGGGTSSGGGGGGCVLASGADMDPVLPLIYAIAMLALWQRRRISRRS